MPHPDELVGRRLMDASGRILTVTGFASWNPAYAELESGDVYRTLRRVDQLLLRDAWLDTPGTLRLDTDSPEASAAR